MIRAKGASRINREGKIARWHKKRRAFFQPAGQSGHGFGR